MDITELGYSSGLQTCKNNLPEMLFLRRLVHDFNGQPS